MFGKGKKMCWKFQIILMDTIFLINKNFIRWNWRYQKRKEICISNRKGEIKTNRRQIHVAQCKFQKEHRENGKKNSF